MQLPIRSITFHLLLSVLLCATACAQVSVAGGETRFAERMMLDRMPSPDFVDGGWVQVNSGRLNPPLFNSEVTLTRGWGTPGAPASIISQFAMGFPNVQAAANAYAVGLQALIDDPDNAANAHIGRLRGDWGASAQVLLGPGFQKGTSSRWLFWARYGRCVIEIQYNYGVAVSQLEFRRFARQVDKALTRLVTS